MGFMGCGADPPYDDLGGGGFYHTFLVTRGVTGYDMV
jgi:hypothetical protein